MKLLKYIMLLCMIFVFVLPFGCSKTTDATVPTLNWRGVNAAGGSINWDKTPSPKSGTHYLFITDQDIDYLASKNVKFVRLLFSWEQVQPELNKPFPANEYNTLLNSRVAYLTSKGITVMLEPHGGLSANFARYKGNLIGSSQVPISSFTDFWLRMSVQFKSNQLVTFALMNEPNNISTKVWFSAAQEAITTLRNSGYDRQIFVPGNGWSHPSTWEDNWYDTATTKMSNAQGFLSLKDPKNNLIATVHSYLDANESGESITVVSPTIGVDKLKKMVAWCRANNVKMHLSEYGGANTPEAEIAIKNLLTYMENNQDVVLGYAFWTYGPPSWWKSYQFTLSPSLDFKTDDPKWAWITPFMNKPIQLDAGKDTAPEVIKSPTFPVNPTIPVVKSISFTTTVNGVTNWVIVPNSYDTSHNIPNSLLIWLHGCGGRNQYDVAMVASAPNNNWITLAPGGKEGVCWGALGTDGPNILAAITDLRNRFNIDPAKIVIGGYSSGGDIGYQLAFQNSSLFHGVIFENTGPNSNAMSLAKTAVNKFKIVNLSHTEDTTYAITSVRANMNTLKTLGFPVTLIEKPGKHWDNDTSTTGTNFDLKQFALPFMSSWFIIPDAGVKDASLPDSSVVDTGVKDSGIDSSIKDASTSDAADAAVTIPIKPMVRVTYSDPNWGFCQLVDLHNQNSFEVSWKEMKLNLRGGKIMRKTDGTMNVWSAKASSDIGVPTFTPETWTAKIAPKSLVTYGLCSTFGPEKWTATVVIDSIK